MRITPIEADLVLQVGHGSELDPAVLVRARELLDLVFADDMTDADWDHAVGGVHALVWHRDTPIGHGSVIQRRLLHAGKALRTGYVEGVAVHPAWRRRGIGGAVMGALEDVVRRSYDLGALGASDEGVAFYESRRWIRWLGPTSALTPAGIVRTPEDDGGVYVWPVVAPLDPATPLTCDWRDGDPW